MNDARFLPGVLNVQVCRKVFHQTEVVASSAEDQCADHVVGAYVPLEMPLVRREEALQLVVHVRRKPCCDHIDFRCHPGLLLSEQEGLLAEWPKLVAAHGCNLFGARKVVWAMAGGIEFDGGKFKELVLLLAWRSKNDPLMSRVKLNKLLYRTDFESFRLYGQSVTGATYVRGEFGPMARELPIAEDDLGREQLLTWETREAGPYEQHVPVALQAPDESKFSNRDLELADKSIAELAMHGGKGASDWSHRQSAGWQARKNGREIPYASAFVSTQPLSDEQMKRAMQRSREEDWASIRP